MNKLFEILLSPFEDPKVDNKFNDHEDGSETNIILPNNEEVELPVLDNNYILHSIDFSNQFRTIKDLIRIYRNVAKNHEVELAIDEIVNDAIVQEDKNSSVQIDLDDIEGLKDAQKKKIENEFKNILRLLNFRRKGAEYFRKWYIDGRLWFQILFNKTHKEIIGVRILSPLDITRLKKEDGTIFYIYQEDTLNKQQRKREQSYNIDKFDQQYAQGLEIPEKDIVFVPSGLVDPERNYYISHLDKAIKPLNQLKLLEDSAVIYRITRAPERRVFYIDVGKLPKTKAEQYVKSLMNKFKSSITYDVQTGKVSNTKNTMTMLEDFYLPTRGDTKGTKVDTLEGGKQLAEMDDINYFKKKLLKSLKVPYNRLDTEDTAVVNIGQNGELTRPELSFQKFIKSLRMYFSNLFLDLLKISLVVKSVMTEGEFNKIRNDIEFIWSTDNYFEELKNNEIMSQRLNILDSMSNYIGTYYSKTWVKKNILQMTDDDIKQMQEEIDDEKQDEEDNMDNIDNQSQEDQGQEKDLYQLKKVNNTDNNQE